MSGHTLTDRIAGLPLFSRLAGRPRAAGGRAQAGLDFEGETLGGRTVVRTAPDRRGRMQRTLIVMGTQQSAMWMDDPYGELVFPYLQLFDLGIDALREERGRISVPADGLASDCGQTADCGQTSDGNFVADCCSTPDCSPDPDRRPLRVLLIGGGGFAWPRHVLAVYPDVALDVVELDPRMIDIARHFFLLDELEATYGVPNAPDTPIAPGSHAPKVAATTGDARAIDRAESGRLRVFCQDGHGYLASLPAGAYDLIANDCFIAGKPAASLADKDAAVLLHHALVPGGIYLTNVVGALLGAEADPIERVAETLGAKFAQVSVVPCEPQTPAITSNNVLIASDIDRPYPGTWMTYRFAG